MKTIKLLFVAVFSLFSIVALAQDKTGTVKVYGNCEMCKARIEKAAKQEGVKKADWNVDTKMLTVTYNADKVKPLDIEKSIAAVGHDTENVTAGAAVYKKLPGCCKYVRKSATNKATSKSAADKHTEHH